MACGACARMGRLTGKRGRVHRSTPNPKARPRSASPFGFPKPDPVRLPRSASVYAGGHKSKADIIEWLVRNPDLELDEARSVCARYGLGGLEELIAESRSV